MLMKKMRFLTFTLLLASILFFPIGIATATTNGLVRVVYFVPNDRPARPDRVPALRQLIKNAQRFFADEMERHGYGRKTFTIETDKNGEPMVHPVHGKFKEDYYYESVMDFKVLEEILEHFDAPEHIYFVVIDMSPENHFGGVAGVSFVPTHGNIGTPAAGKATLRLRDETRGEEVLGGIAIIPTYNVEFLGLTVHELGHAFGLDHDFREARNTDYVMAYGSQSRLSKCSAEWLSVSRFFNSKPISPNTPGEIQFLSMQAYSSGLTSLRFKVTDLDGLHQAQLLLPDITQDGGWGPYSLFDCKRLNGKTSSVESVVRTAELVDRVTLQMMDVKGHITWATFPIELDKSVLDRDVLDVNNDGIVNILDLPPIASRYGRRGKHPADVNEDNAVDITDLLLVAAIVSALPRHVVETFDATEVQRWLTDANALGIENEYQQKGIVFLQHLLTEIDVSSRLTEAATAPLKAIFGGHTDVVRSLAFSPDGQTLASASEDRTIRLWDPHTAELKTLLIGHTQPVNSIAFSPDGETLASASTDTTTRLWNPHTGEHKTTLRAHTGHAYIRFHSVSFSPDGQILATGGGYYNNFSLRLWDLDNAENIRTLIGHTNRITSIAFSPNGQILASASADDPIRLWNPRTGQLKTTLKGHTREVESVAFSPDGQTLASGSQDRTIRLWNPRTGQLKITLTGYTGWVNPVALAFSSDGETLACGGYNIIHFWDAQTGQYENTLEGETGHTLSIAFSPDGQTLVSGGEDGTVRLWELVPDDRASDKTTVDTEIFKPTQVVHVDAAQRPPLYWVDATTGTLHRLIADEVENLLPTVKNATSLAVDMAGGKLYWGEKTGERTGRIRGANLNGRNVKLVKNLTSVPLNIALDPSGGMIYLTNAWGKIQRLNIDGSNFQPNLITGLKSPKHLNLDVAGGKVYWTETAAESGRIRRANLDGSSVQNVATGLRAPLSLSVASGKVYWTSGRRLHRANLGGTNRGSLETLPSVPTGIAFDPARNSVYLTSPSGGIYRRNLDDIVYQPVVTSLASPSNIVLGISATDPVPHVNRGMIPDANLAAAVQEALGLGSNARITKQKMKKLIELKAPNSEIKDLTGLEHATQLTFINFMNNQIRDVSPLTGLTQLRQMSLDGNHIREIMPIASLKNLWGLGLGWNTPKISDITPLASLTKLKWLRLTGNQIRDVSPLAALTNLETLWIKQNRIQDFSPLTQLKKLRNVDIEIPRLAGAAPTRIALPNQTLLLANYPNPFNPETWIPYQLAKPSDVKITIYDARGTVVRHLDLGHQAPGFYTSRSRAVYWDGKNALGEPVASGVYFYQLQTNDVSPLREMVILK